jgi:hypothetical protein
MRSNDDNGRRKESVWRSVPAQGSTHAHASIKTSPDSVCNRRTFFRLPTAVAISVRNRNADITKQWSLDLERESYVLSTSTEDFSIGGLRFRAPVPLAQGTRVDIAVELPDREPLELDAVVTHVVTDDFGASIGAAFVGVNELQSARLARFISGAQRRYLPTVSALFTVKCRTEGASFMQGVTRHCAPGYIEMLLPESIAPASAVELLVTVDHADVVLRGNVVSSREDCGLWRAGVEFDEIPPAIATRWREVIFECRDGFR